MQDGVVCMAAEVISIQDGGVLIAAEIISMHDDKYVDKYVDVIRFRLVVGVWQRRNAEYVFEMYIYIKFLQ